MMHGFPGKQPGSYILYAEILHRKHNEEEQQQGKKQTKLKGKMVGIPFSREMAGFKMGCKIEDKYLHRRDLLLLPKNLCGSGALLSTMSVDLLSSIAFQVRSAWGKLEMASSDFVDHCRDTAKKRKLADESADELNSLCNELITKLQTASSDIVPLTDHIATLDKESTRLEELVAKKKEEIAKLEVQKNQAVITKGQLEVQKTEALSNIEQLKELIATAKRIHVVQSNCGKSYTFSLFPCAAS